MLVTKLNMSTRGPGFNLFGSNDSLLKFQLNMIELLLN